MKGIITMYPRAVFIGPREIGELIRMNRNDLDFLYRFSHIEELYDKIINEEINHDFEIIITIDQLFFSNENTNNNCEHMIATLSTRFLVIIIQYNPNEEKELREKISNAAIDMGKYIERNYFFISPKKPNIGIDHAKNVYTDKHSLMWSDPNYDY